MRLLFVVAFLGCESPSPPPTTTGGDGPSHPGAPFVRLLESCGVLSDERVWCDSAGFIELLRGARTFASGGALFSLDASEYATCFARADGIVRCIGGDAWGGLAGGIAREKCEGTGWFGSKYEYACAKKPVIARLPQVAQLSRQCALTPTGDVYCWGRRDRWSPIFAPTKIEGIDGRAVRISAEIGGDRVCAILRDGHVACAAANAPGAMAQAVPWLENVVDVGLGMSIGCFVSAGGIMDCYDQSSDYVFERVATPLRFTRVSTSFSAICGITVDARVACWKRKMFADEESSARPTLVDGIENATDLYVDDLAVYILLTDGRAYARSHPPHPEVWTIAP